MRLIKTWLPLLAAVLLLAGCATKLDRNNALQEAQYAWSAAIRWGDFEGAFNMLDPKLRAEHPVTDLEFARYKQVQISEYRDLGAQVRDGTAVRVVMINVVNRNTLVERQVRYTEAWRYDPASKTWWVTSGLPDLWQ
ncbi:MAG TPA: hypothetical protein VLM17_10970 [Xanthomonadaceae bacterium]|nr:hypothetical protein [Xanthomonadaceae bacterium]